MEKKCKNNEDKAKIDIYNMGFHETIEVKTNIIHYFITKVHGGWIYNHPRLDNHQMNSVFVPFSDFNPIND